MVSGTSARVDEQRGVVHVEVPNDPNASCGPFEYVADETDAVREMDKGTNNEQHERIVIKIDGCARFTADFFHAGARNFHSHMYLADLVETFGLKLDDCSRRKSEEEKIEAMINLLKRFKNLHMICRFHFESRHESFKSVTFDENGVAFEP